MYSKKADPVNDERDLEAKKEQGGSGMAKYVMALDAGTTSNRCILFNEKRTDMQYGTEGVYTVFSEARMGGA